MRNFLWILIFCYSFLLVEHLPADTKFEPLEETKQKANINNFIQEARRSSLFLTHEKRQRRKRRLSLHRNKVVHTSTTAKKQKVFLSHNWGKNKKNHERVKELNKQLKGSNLVETWFDETDMKGHIVQDMCRGIDECDCIIVFITREYINKCNSSENDNCKLELDYSFERKGCKKIIPLVMEEDCLDTTTWNGPIGAYLNKRIYLPFLEGDFSFLEKLIQEIKRVSELI